MGFGSYDESEQENQNADTDYDDDDAVSVHENDHDGSVSFDTGATSGELVDRLQDMKDDGDDEP
ncbi:hypothetical protein MBEHAL_0478 [Halarchaeum acidiphilum MH1-52-1]|uniref:DUF5786 domain-containing protein n=1 Tax=Halarchaeum acidiphilum MH1-52-1 TaxID=1261545 RepID=U3AAC6_9EURY|nr:DUF5786 family protein [Halarchaeum acidiphilum]GAD51718.1 hypothetical protein MBEHAL_0478 [Halarchaeum acidiphilum MH1-52-1]